MGRTTPALEIPDGFCGGYRATRSETALLGLSLLVELASLENLLWIPGHANPYTLPRCMVGLVPLGSEREVES
jgi:hypothetical protein